MPRLSIVIPVLGDPQQLDDTLLSVWKIVRPTAKFSSSTTSLITTPTISAMRCGSSRPQRGAGVVECLNRGLAASRSPVVHVLACGVEVCPGWADAGLRHFGDPAIAAVAAVVLDRDDREKIVSAGLGYRIEGTAWRLGRHSRPDNVAACRQDLSGPDTLAAFYRKSAIESVGGFSPWAGDALAGIDLALALRQAGFRCALEPQCVAHVGAAATDPEPAFRYGRNAERLFWRWASSQGWLASLAGHVALLAGLCVISLWRPSRLLQLAGRVCGAIQAMFAKRPAKPVKRLPSRSHRWLPPRTSPLSLAAKGSDRPAWREARQIVTSLA